MKTQEELKALREEVEAPNAKLAELSDEELTQVTGGGRLPEGITYKYRVGQLVKTGITGFTLEITAEDGWYETFKCPQYKAVIKALPDNYHGTWKVGQPYSTYESNIEPA